MAPLCVGARRCDGRGGVFRTWLRLKASCACWAIHVLQLGGAGASPVVSPPPVHKIFFVKTHGTGSSTVTNILHRLCATYSLECFLPTKKLMGQTYGKTLLERLVQRRGSDPAVHIFPNHCDLHPPLFDQLIPGNTKISIFRHPFDRIVSIYSHWSGPLKQAVKALQDGKEPPQGCFSPMTGHVPVQKFHTLDFVLLLEKFEVGLVMMRRQYGWRLRDIIFLPLKSTGDVAGKDVLLAQLQRPRHDATRKFLAECVEGQDMTIYRMAQRRWYEQWEALGTKGQAEVREETRKFVATLTKVSACCAGPSAKEDWLCWDMLEDNKAWVYRRRGDKEFQQPRPTTSTCARLVPD